MKKLAADPAGDSCCDFMWATARPPVQIETPRTLTHYAGLSQMHKGVNTQTCEVLHRFENCARILRFASQSGR
jgi:hypothetical protein